MPHLEITEPLPDMIGAIQTTPGRLYMFFFATAVLATPTIILGLIVRPCLGCVLVAIGVSSIFGLLVAAGDIENDNS